MQVCVWDWPRPREGHYFVAKHEGRRHPAEDCPTARAGARRGFEARPAPGRPGSEGERAGGQGGAAESAAGHAVRGWTPATDRAVTADVWGINILTQEVSPFRDPIFAYPAYDLDL